MSFVNAIARFVERNPTFKVLALSFLILIGMALLGEGLDFHIPKGYVYFAMGFAVPVEILNIRRQSKSAQPLKMHDPYRETGEPMAVVDDGDEPDEAAAGS